MRKTTVALPLTGRIALVSGNSAGLGKEIGITLGKAGAKVPVNYCNNKVRAEQTLAEYQAAGIETCLVKADVTSEQGVSALFDTVEKELGKPDIIVPNATCEQPDSLVENYSWETYQSMVDCFIKSPFLMVKRSVPYMKKQRWGRIINITSEVFHRGSSQCSAYVSAKGGQVGFTRSIATELAPFGITANMVAPGWIPAERVTNVKQSTRDRYLNTIPMQRWGTPPGGG